MEKLEQYIKHLQYMKRLRIKIERLKDKEFGMDMSNSTQRSRDKIREDLNYLHVDLEKAKLDAHTLSVECGFADKRDPEYYEVREFQPNAWMTLKHHPREPKFAEMFIDRIRETYAGAPNFVREKEHCLQVLKSHISRRIELITKEQITCLRQALANVAITLIEDENKVITDTIWQDDCQTLVDYIFNELDINYTGDEKDMLAQLKGEFENEAQK